MIKVDVNELLKGTKKVMSLNSQNGSIMLDVKKDTLTMYYADGHDTLVDTVPVESDTEASYIVSITELNRVLGICQPSQGIEADVLTITPEEKTLVFQTTKHIKADDAAATSMRVYQVIGFRNVGESAKDALLTKTDYTTLWNQEKYDLWDKASLIGHLKAMINAGGKCILYNTHSQLIFTQSTRYVMLQKVDAEENVYGIAIPTAKAKALVDILTQMRTDSIQVTNNMGDTESTEKRLMFVSDTTAEGYSCAIATVSKQDILALQYFSALSSLSTELRVNKKLLQEVVAAMSSANIEQCTAKTICTEEANILRLTNAVKVSDYCDIYLSGITDKMRDESFVLNIKSLSSMFPHLKGTDVVVSLFEQNDGTTITSYLKIAEAGCDDTVYYMATAKAD